MVLSFALRPGTRLGAARAMLTHVDASCQAAVGPSSCGAAVGVGLGQLRGQAAVGPDPQQGDVSPARVAPPGISHAEHVQIVPLAAVRAQELLQA
eukprot:356430-Chlamydomonas_euryale.AAC.3